MESAMHTTPFKKNFLMMIMLMGVGTAVFLTHAVLARSPQAPAAPAASAALPAPVGYWRMENDQTNGAPDYVYLNTATGTYDLTLVGTVDAVIGPPDNSFPFYTATGVDPAQNGTHISLYGSGNYLQVSDNSAYDLSTGMTIAGWVNRADDDADQKIIGQLKLNGSDRSGYVLGIAGGTLIGEVYDSAGSGFVVNGGAIPGSTWTHVALTWQSGGKFTAYVNGTQTGQVNASALPIGAECQPGFGGCALIIGGAPWAPTASNYEGFLDEMVVFNQAISTGQVAELAQRTFVVNSTDDTASGCTDAACNLRAAMTAANESANGALPDRIHFALPNDSVIQPASELPAISEAVQIDGKSGETCASEMDIILDGGNLTGNKSGLYLGPGADGSWINGLVITHFPTAGIYISSDGNRVTCSRIGVDQDINDAGNQYGILVTGSGNLIGSETATNDVNVIAGNDVSGITIFQHSTVPAGNSIGHNYIGWGVLSSNVITNGVGIHLDTGVQNTSVITNFITANSAQGILATNTAATNDSTISHNWIGYPSSIPGSQSSGAQGIRLLNAPGYRITENRIWYNTGDGIAVEGSSSGVFILDNIIGGNGGMGIDLGSDGPTANDAGDGDSGPNGLQNYPVLDTAIADGATITVTGTLQSQPNGLYALSFYLAENEGSCQGALPLSGRVERQADANGEITFSVASPYTASGAFQVTALAIDLTTSNTSEFAPCLPVMAPQIYLPMAIRE